MYPRARPLLWWKNRRRKIHPGKTAGAIRGSNRRLPVVDGIDLRTCTQSSLRGQMGIVLQDPFLFSGTIRENIRFGRLEASDAEVEDAARAVGADEFIRNTRLGYETPVEEGGVMLSVGQRQLISFARALLANPRILILDEATSSVDTQTEMVIQKALNRLFKGRTSFVIAPPPSTVVNADKIVVIEDGQMWEQGCHVELLAKNGAYFRLYSMRFENKIDVTASEIYFYAHRRAGLPLSGRLQRPAPCQPTLPQATSGVLPTQTPPSPSPTSTPAPTNTSTPVPTPDRRISSPLEGVEAGDLRLMIARNTKRRFLIMMKLDTLALTCSFSGTNPSLPSKVTRYRLFLRSVAAWYKTVTPSATQ